MGHWAPGSIHTHTSTHASVAGLLLVLVMAVPAVAGSVVVDPAGGGDYLTIQSALDWASDGDEILIAAGTYEETLNHSSGKDFTLEPLVDGELVEIVGDGSSSYAMYLASSVLLKNIVFNGATLDTINGIYFTDGILSIHDCTFSGFSARAIYLTDAAYHLSARNSVFSDNRNSIQVDDVTGACVVDVFNCDFVENGLGYSRGSGISFLASPNTSSSIDIQSCNFVSNIGLCGAAIYLTGKVDFGIYGSRFIGNTSSATGSENHGGAVFVHVPRQDSSFIRNCIFVGNSIAGTGKGGALAITHLTETESLSFWLMDSIFSGNSSESGGGAIYMNVFQPGDYRINIENSQLIGNSTDGDGGGLLVESVEGVDLTDTYFCANTPNPAAGYFNDESGNTFVDTCSAGACCVDDVCAEMTEEACDSVDGLWIGAGTNCMEFDCSEPITGACCLVRFCDLMGASVCEHFGGTFYPNTQCSAVICDPLPICPGDFNLDGQVAIEDLLDVIGNWGACP